MSATLYELADLRDIIDAALVASEGELTDELAAALDAWEEKFADKAERIALYICDEEGDAAKIKAEEEKLAARRKAKLHRCEWLTRYLEAQMQRVGKQRIDGVLKTLVMQKNPASVTPLTPMDDTELRNISTFAPRYIRHSESWALDKKAILDDHKAGTLDPDMAKRVAVQQTTSLRIR